MDKNWPFNDLFQLDEPPLDIERIFVAESLEEVQFEDIPELDLDQPVAQDDIVEVDQDSESPKKTNKMTVFLCSASISHQDAHTPQLVRFKEKTMSDFDDLPERWGEFTDGSDLKSEQRAGDFFSPKQKLDKLKLSNITTTESNDNQVLTFDNPLVTQTVEVMNQTEFIQTLLDTYASDAQSSFLNQNEGIFMPHIDLTPDVTANLVSDEKFMKPMWFIPPHETEFTKGLPISVPKISKPVVMEAIRTSLCGLVRIRGFNDSTDSALQMFTDGVDEFFKCFMDSINSVLTNENQDRNKTLTIATLEKAFNQNNSSLTTLHNYYKNEIIARNKNEIDELKNVYQDYDKLMQENLNMQKTLNNMKSFSLGRFSYYDGLKLNAAPAAP
ncbi:hypothetical protein Bhyg_08400 [Pseudolycoriella hygida]|uniref:Uncharacterized protein n=1 Tax=Pseudolycoriella hygida TaxID=35572 RepID=A0A9Q0S3K9_9DIPT|nr:hypothetical protein Bhyg_08400 [Pseudolycoriella hygida]